MYLPCSTHLGLLGVCLLILSSLWGLAQGEACLALQRRGARGALLERTSPHTSAQFSWTRAKEAIHRRMDCGLDSLRLQVCSAAAAEIPAGSCLRSLSSPPYNTPVRPRPRAGLREKSALISPKGLATREAMWCCRRLGPSATRVSSAAPIKVFKPHGRDDSGKGLDLRRPSAPHRSG
jgi:hypothetical protein